MQIDRKIRQTERQTRLLLTTPRFAGGGEATVKSNCKMFVILPIFDEVDNKFMLKKVSRTVAALDWLAEPASLSSAPYRTWLTISIGQAKYDPRKRSFLWYRGLLVPSECMVHSAHLSPHTVR